MKGFEISAARMTDRSNGALFGDFQLFVIFENAISLQTSMILLPRMKLSWFLLPSALVLAACGPLPPSPGQTQSIDTQPIIFPVVTGEAGANDIGLFLAGKPLRHGAVLSQLQQESDYQAHQRDTGQLWRNRVLPRINVMRSWAGGEVTPVIGGGGTVYYPFGGPDLLHVWALFPQAQTYVLMGLEPVGEVPRLESLPQGEVLAKLAAFRQSTKTQLLAGYFITKDMRSDLERSTLRGVTPILLSTVALMGGTVESVSSISVGGNPGVEMRYSDASGMRHTAYYVSGDLSNSGFNSAYQQWVAGLGGKATYFKSASYLMHDGRFSKARDFFLSRSRAILQDDSGIPFRYFPRDQWDCRLYGRYEKPIALFAKHQQVDLRQAFEEGTNGPLTFGAGYQIDYLEANLMFAIKR
jgi:hypothetical protein